MTDTVAATEVEPVTRVGQDGLAVRITHNLGWTLIYLGVLTLGFVVHQLYITSWFAQQRQPELAAERIEQ